MGTYLQKKKKPHTQYRHAFFSKQHSTYQNGLISMKNNSPEPGLDVSRYTHQSPGPQTSKVSSIQWPIQTHQCESPLQYEITTNLQKITKFVMI